MNMLNMFCCTAWSNPLTMQYLVSHTPHQGLKLVDTNLQLPPETDWLPNDRIGSEPWAGLSYLLLTDVRPFLYHGDSAAQ